jgi:hypothetical protein
MWRPLSCDPARVTISGCRRSSRFRHAVDVALVGAAIAFLAITLALFGLGGTAAFAALLSVLLVLLLLLCRTPLLRVGLDGLVLVAVIHDSSPFCLTAIGGG